MPTFVVEREYAMPCTVKAEIKAATEEEALTKLDQAVDDLRKRVASGEKSFTTHLHAVDLADAEEVP